MLDPHQQFVVMYLTRYDIASIFNDMIAERELAIRRFSKDDERLTDEFCGKVAEEWSDIVADDLDEEERGQAQRDMIHSLLLTVIPKNVDID